MDNIYFKTLLNKFSGFVYQYIGQTPADQDIKSFIVDEFVSEASRNGLELSVIQLANGTFIVHSYHDLESEKFVKLHNLSEHHSITIETTPEPEPEPEGDA